MAARGALACLTVILCWRAASGLHPTAQATREHALQQRDVPRRRDSPRRGHAPHNASVTNKRRGALRRGARRPKRNASEVQQQPDHQRLLKEEAPLQPPRLVISGIGDSGTTAITLALQSFGLEFCVKQQDNFHAEPWDAHHSWRFGTRERQISRLLQAANGSISTAGYNKAGKYFRYTVAFLQKVARSEASCLEKQLNTTTVPEDVIWGFKEPHWVYFIPAAQEAFANRTKFLVVARDPRDICTNKLQDQFIYYSQFFKRGIAKQSCFHWWAVLWDELLNNFENDPNFAVLRMEDLVLPAPTTSSPSASALQCVMKFAGLRPNFMELQRVLLQLNDPGSDGAAELAQWHHSTSTRHKGSDGAAELAQWHHSTSTRHKGSDAAEVPPPLVGKEQARKSLQGFHAHRFSYMGHHYFQSELRRKTVQEDFASSSWPPVVHKSAMRLGYDPNNFGLMVPTSRAVCQ